MKLMETCYRKGAYFGYLHKRFISNGMIFTVVSGKVQDTGRVEPRRMIESGICTAKQEYLHLSMEQDFYLIMLSGKPDSVVDLFSGPDRNLPMAYLLNKEEEIHPNWHHDVESLLNGLLVSYPQGPKEGDPDLFRHYARLVIERLVELRGYRNSYELISNQATKLFQIYGKTPSKLAMITAGMIDNQ